MSSARRSSVSIEKRRLAGQLRRRIILPGERDVPGGFLRVRSQPRVLNHLAGDDRDILNRNVRDCVFCDGGMAVADHPFLMELAGLSPRRLQFSLVQRVRNGAPSQVQVAFSQQAQQVRPQVFPAPRIVREEDRDDFLRQPLQGKDRRIQGGNIGSQ